ALRLWPLTLKCPWTARLRSAPDVRSPPWRAPPSSALRPRSGTARRRLAPWPLLALWPRLRRAPSRPRASHSGCCWNQVGEGRPETRPGVSTPPLAVVSPRPCGIVPRFRGLSLRRQTFFSRHPLWRALRLWPLTLKRPWTARPRSAPDVRSPPWRAPPSSALWPRSGPARRRLALWPLLALWPRLRRAPPRPRASHPD